MQKTEDRKKVNFMVDKQILLKLGQLVPNRKRSDFVNKALEEAMTAFGRKKASDSMDALAEELRKSKIHMSTAEFIKLKNYGRM